ncbi:hypothetical protein GGX14DRAFT_637678 [Mycena pura]|uniref:Uncharacterized protein n=1 Tax=Mycena pura TaxID=153505 RepID=A0AAD6VDE8_9AGAR|nr:hypothetical protein GGX14DRAFT_637678 [Mycena pura]
MTHFMTPNGNRCPYCGNQLAVKVAKTGDMPNSRYIRCTNPHQPDRVYFHRFPSPLLAPVNTAPPPASSLLTAAPPTFSNPSTSSGKPTCSARGCKSARLDPGCPRAMCRRHCNEAGPCVLRAHERERVRKSAPAATASPTAPPAQTAAPRARRHRQSIASTLPFTDYSSLDDWIAHTLPPILALETHQQQRDAERSFLDELPGVKSPTPETETVRERYEREEREDAARLALGLRLSQEHNNAAAGPSQSPPPPLRLPASILQAGRPRSFSPPASLPSPRPISSSPDFPTRLLPLASHKGKARATKTAAPLRIMTQLNADWMFTSPSPSTFHIKKKAPASARSFMVVYWAAPNTSRRTFVIDDVPAWPRWRICEATGRFAELLGASADIELYFPKYTSWAEVRLTFVHTVTTDCVIMLRRAGVDCLHLEPTIRKFYPDTDVVHIRKNLPGERAALRRLYKHSRIPTGDSDVEVVSEKKRIKTEDDAGDELPRRQRPRLHVEDDVVIIDDTDDDASTPTLTDDDASTPTLTTASSTSSAPSPALSSLSLPTTTIRWPVGIHVVDMVAGFQKMDSPELAAYDRMERFKRAFEGYQYRASTVTEQRAIYRSATRAEVKKGVAAGRTKDGLWSVWRRQLAANTTGI